jgi:hypothetical protein
MPALRNRLKQGDNAIEVNSSATIHRINFFLFSYSRVRSTPSMWPSTIDAVATWGDAVYGFKYQRFAAFLAAGLVHEGTNA